MIFVNLDANTGKSMLSAFSFVEGEMEGIMNQSREILPIKRLKEGGAV